MRETILKPCPFCGGKVELHVSDDEGNARDEAYEADPWSGLSFRLMHEEESNRSCPIATHENEQLGIFLYDSREEAATAWNTRLGHDQERFMEERKYRQEKIEELEKWAHYKENRKEILTKVLLDDFTKVRCIQDVDEIPFFVDGLPLGIQSGSNCSFKKGKVYTVMVAFNGHSYMGTVYVNLAKDDNGECHALIFDSREFFDKHFEVIEQGGSIDE